MFEFAKARHEIEDRNRIRAQAYLPSVAVAGELRKMYEVQRGSNFEEFLRTSPIRKRIEDKLLNRIRRMRGDPNWIPTGFLSGAGFAFYARTRSVMARVWRMRQARPRRRLA
jgi:hypothetical protein